MLWIPKSTAVFCFVILSKRIKTFGLFFAAEKRPRKRLGIKKAGHKSVAKLFKLSRSK